ADGYPQPPPSVCPGRHPGELYPPVRLQRRRGPSYRRSGRGPGLLTREAAVIFYDLLKQKEALPLTEVVSVRFRGGAKNYYFDPNGLTIQPGDYVVVETAQGMEYVCCVEGNH